MNANPNSLSRRELLRASAGMLAVGMTREQAPGGAEWATLVEKHPAGDALKRLFPSPPSQAPEFEKTRLTRADYLPIIAGIVDFFKTFQNPEGAIIDPYERKERQYSTPAFALAAAALIQEANRRDLFAPAIRALDFSIGALANHTTADNHADFYIPLVIHARRRLAGIAPKPTMDEWTRRLRGLIPEKTYHDVGAGGNWNIVNVAGELLRAKDELVPDDQKEAQAAYIDSSLKKQSARFTKFGMYEDPNAPLAYDAFPRLWLEDALANDAYHGPRLDRLREFLSLGSFSTLLLLSPCGEWACGGRSAHHQWNEAQVAVICEINAQRWKMRNRPDLSGAFKRAARLALGSIKRWRRPSGEIWIVKNHADPSLRHGYESYSFHSQYNLLPAAMLAIAHEFSDDTIQELPLPSELGGYLFDLRDTFHKVCASAAGHYVLIDTGADAHYNATGLLRYHRAGVPLSPLSDNSPSDRNYSPRGEPLVAIGPGIAWKTGDGAWQSLAGYHNAAFEKAYGPTVVRAADLAVKEEKPERVAFAVRYELAGEGARPVEEEYSVSKEGVVVTARLSGGDVPAASRAIFPALVSDGAVDTHVSIEGSRLTIGFGGGTLTYEVVAPGGVSLKLDGPRVPVRNGFMQAVVGELPAGTRELKYRLRLKKEYKVENSSC